MPQAPLPTIFKATKAYEAWAAEHIPLIPRDLALKHHEMRGDVFAFMRATFYRWAQLFPRLCPDLAETPRVLAVGDLHVENFGTWRDREGRLIWGVNDFDEAFPMPYAIDLVRLASSALLAIGEGSLSLGGDVACAAILAGYRAVILKDEGCPFVLEEAHPSLRDMALSEERDPVKFWTRLTSLAAIPVPRGVRKLLRKQFPASVAKLDIVHRVAGLGSLGRLRYVALAECAGGLMAREAKPVLPSAYGWAAATRDDTIYIEEIMRRAVRVPDPFLTLKKGWLLRRLGPHCTRIELGDFPKARDERHILRAMGHETANIHLGTPSMAAAIRKDLRDRGAGWLVAAAKKMAKATEEDWAAWRKAAKA